MRESGISRVTAREGYIKHFHLSPLLYAAVLLFIGLAEFPLNSIVFQLFGDQKLYTLIASFALGLTIPLGAHLLGGLLRHGFLPERKFGTSSAAILAIIISVVGGIAAIAYLREKFFEGSGVQGELNINMDPTTVTLVFVAINLLLFVVSTIAAYVEHNPEATKHRLALRDAERLHRNAKQRVKLLERQQGKNQDRCSNVAATREKIFNRTQHQVKEQRDWMQRLMSVYRTQNLRERSETTMPKCFKEFPPTDVPSCLAPDAAQLNWDCQGVLKTGQIGERAALSTDVEDPTKESVLPVTSDDYSTVVHQADSAKVTS